MDANDQQSSKTIALKVHSSIGTCRLRNGLNADCLLKIMQFLNIYDLKQLCNMDPYYKDLITKWVIGKRLFNFPRIKQTSDVEVLEEFGKSMRKIVIYDSNVLSFLDTIIEWFAPDTLTEVELNLISLQYENALKPSTEVNHIPILSNIRKFKLNMLSLEYSTFDNFMTALLVSATNLTHLHLYLVQMDGHWLEHTKMLNLFELRIIYPYKVSVARLEIFLSCSPKLRRFIYKGDIDLTALGTTLFEKCPNLEVFEDVHITEFRETPTASKTRYNFLASFANLNTVTLTSHAICNCDLYYALTELAHRNIVHLNVFVKLETAVSFNKAERQQILQNCSFSHFVSLSSLDLEIENYGLDVTSQCEFILLFASQLKNLEKFTIKSNKRANVNIEKIIEPWSQIRTLSISQAKFKHLPVVMRKIVRTVRAMRRASDMFEGRVVLQLIVNIRQWRELKVYKDIDKLIETVIDHQTRPTVSAL